MTTLMERDLWDDPVRVAELLQQMDDVRGAAGGGQGSSLAGGGQSWETRGTTNNSR